MIDYHQKTKKIRKSKKMQTMRGVIINCIQTGVPYMTTGHKTIIYNKEKGKGSIRHSLQKWLNVMTIEDDKKKIYDSKKQSHYKYYKNVDECYSNIDKIKELNNMTMDKRVSSLNKERDKINEYEKELVQKTSTIGKCPYYGWGNGKGMSNEIDELEEENDILNHEISLLNKNGPDVVILIDNDFIDKYKTHGYQLKKKIDLRINLTYQNGEAPDSYNDIDWDSLTYQWNLEETLIIDEKHFCGNINKYIQPNDLNESIWDDLDWTYEHKSVNMESYLVCDAWCLIKT